MKILNTGYLVRSGCVLLSFLLVACGGGGSGDGAVETAGAAEGNPPPVTNSPTISGTPAAQVTIGSEYDFTPTASDPDGDLVTFTIANQPEWASFDVNTGRLRGTPEKTNGVPPVLTDTLVQLSLEEGSGTLVSDASGQGNDGTLVNGPVFGVDTADGSAFGLRFDGVDDYVDLGTFDAAGTGLTLASWFKADSYPGDPRLISKATSTEENGHVFMLSTTASDGATRLRGRLKVGGATTTLIATTGNLDTGVWHHAALTHDGTTLRLYLDGVEVGSTALSGVVDQNPSVAVAVGSQPAGAGGQHFDGLIDDVRILQRALTAAEIATVLTGNAGASSSDAGIYPDIRISVSDGSDSASLSAFTITVLDLLNQAPTITGPPVTVVTQGGAYSFSPTANDPDGDILTFSIDNQPSWADFDSTNGMLSGTPGVNDVGSHAAIVISVSDGSDSATLSAFDIEVLGTATGAAALSWTIPTENDDGTPIGNDLAGFRIYYSMTSGNYSEFVPVNSTVSTGMVENLSPGTWFFVVTAYSFSGNESVFSNEVLKTIDEIT